MEIQQKSTNIQRSRNNKNKQWKFNKKVPTYNALEIIKINNGNSTKKAKKVPTYNALEIIK